MKVQYTGMGRLLFYDQEMLDRDLKRVAAKRNAPAHDGTRQDTRQAAQLEDQARREQQLAAKVADPKLKALIANSATGKTERAQELKTGKPIDPKTSKYEQRLEYSTWRVGRRGTGQR